MFLPPPEAVVAQVLRGLDATASKARRCLQHLLASLGRVAGALWRRPSSPASRSASPSASTTTARGIFEPIIEFYRPIPPLAYLPLVIIWFGIGEFAKILVIFLGILPSIVIATATACARSPQDRINAARALGASRLPGRDAGAAAACACRAS